MAKQTLDPHINDKPEDTNFDPGVDFSNQDWNDKVNAANTPADLAAQDQRDAAARDSSGSEIPYSPDPKRRQLAADEGRGRADQQASSNGSNEHKALAPLADSDEPIKPKSKNRRGRVLAFLGNRYTQGGVLSGGIVGVLVSGFIGFTPFQILHIANLLQSWHFWDDDQTGNWSSRRAYNYARGQRQYNNLGVLPNVLADRYEKRLTKAGIDIDYKDPEGRSRSSAQKMIINLDSPAGRDFANKMEVEFPDRSTRVGNNLEVDLRGRGSSKLGRSAVSAAVSDVLQMNRVSSGMAKRTLKRRMGVNFRPLTNLARERGESRADRKRAARERRAEEVKNGVDSDTYDGDRGDRRPADEEGNKTDTDIDSETRNGANGYIDETTGLSDESVSTDKKGRMDNLVKRLISGRAASAAGVAVAVVGLSCAAQDIGEEAEKVQHAQTILPMARLAMQVVTAASQIQVGSETGDMSAETVSEISETFYDLKAEEEKAGTGSFFAAKPVQAEMGKEPNGTDIPDSAKPGKIGEEPAFLAILNSIPALDKACGVNDWVNGVIGSIPGISHALDAMEELASGAIRAATGKGIDEWMESLIYWIAGEAVDPFATGSELGALSAYGAKLASNDAMMAQGGSELSNTQMTQWKKIQRKTLLAERKHQSLYTRMLDLKNPNSLSAMALLETPATTSHVAFLDTLKKRPTNVFSGIKESVSRVITPSAYAQESYDYGFNDFGFGPEVLDDDRYSNPYCNAAYVTGSECVGDPVDPDYPSGGSTSRNDDGTVTVRYSENKLPDFNDSWGKCFGDPVDDDGNPNSEEQEDYKDVVSDDCKNASGEDFNRYRIFILDRVNAAALSCYENIHESSCDEIGISSGGNSSDTDLGGPIPEDVAGPEDIRTTSGCGGIEVHMNWLAVVEEMCTAAAADGLNLTGGGWRDYQQQIEHRKTNCGESQYAIYEMPASQCSPATAKPGRSNHEKGLAIDFDNCSTRSSRCHQWLKNYAHPQIVNLPSEPWHWSVNGG